MAERERREDGEERREKEGGRKEERGGRRNKGGGRREEGGVTGARGEKRKETAFGHVTQLLNAFLCTYSTLVVGGKG